MTTIEEILRADSKPKQKQTMLVNAVVLKKIPAKEFLAFFELASDVDKGTCADVMKHVSAKSPELLLPHIDVLVRYINYKAPRVKWGVPEAIGNMARAYPDEVVRAIPHLLKNTTESGENTTVVRWCAAFALTEIAKHNPGARSRLLSVFQKKVKAEKNNGVKNVYVKALKAIEKSSKSDQGKR